MAQTFKLTAPIGSRYVADPDDVSKTKKALMRTGDYEIPSYGLTPYPDTPRLTG